MPELPEVETVVLGLKPKLPGRRILAVRFDKTDFIEDPAKIERDLPGCLIQAVRRHGKFILIELRSLADPGAQTLVVHLGMTGQLVVRPPEATAPPHTHMFIALDDGRELRYTDIRRFGRIYLTSLVAGAAFREDLGLDALEVTEPDFAARLSERSAHIKALLLNQRVLRGMGNIYTDESLWRARIHPRRLGSSLNQREMHKLYQAVQKTLKEAIRHRGSSVSDYVDADGERGNFQQRHRAYGREGKKCARCGGLIRRIIVAGRSSYFCPHCQRLRSAHSAERRAETGIYKSASGKPARSN